MERKEMIELLRSFCYVHNCESCPINTDVCDFSNMTNAELDNCVKIVNGESHTKISDPVNHPTHYELPGGMEVVDVEIATQGPDSVKDHCICAAIEYLLRHKRKNGVEDVRKAHWWLSKYIELEGKLE